MSQTLAQVDHRVLAEGMIDVPQHTASP